jgi:hypothetical protein
MACERRWTDEQLSKAVASSRTCREVLDKLGLARGGDNHYKVIRRARELGLDMSHFTRTPGKRERSWNDELLRRAIAAVSSYPSLVAQLGIDMSEVAPIRRRIKVLGLDTRHFSRTPSRGGGRGRRWTDDELVGAVQISRSVAQVIRKLGLIPAGGNYDLVQQRIRALGLDTTHFTGSLGGRSTPTPATPLHEILVANRFTSSHKLKKRLIREGIKQARCERCGWAERAPDGRVPLELDHVNGDKFDNRIENIRILCPNCHALQPTHRGLNQKRRKTTS